MKKYVITITTGEKITIFGNKSFDQVTDDLHYLELMTARSEPTLTQDNLCFRTLNVVLIQEVIA